MRAGLGLVLLVFLLAACGDNPQDVTRKFYEAFEYHEFSKAKAYVCPALFDELDFWIREEGDLRIETELAVSYNQVEQSENRIIMQIAGTGRRAGQEFPVRYQVRVEKLDDGWKVCDMQPIP